ncbi:hypothetical protein MAM1_0005c00592 [Mucor ambiguus]|uniref:Uncharacterized protein n=1 Tax=Mucor ambiguus TaxID=91626 RepID=A0A0C9M033_9FUNG|nr:hypothetical protein MAM1_0005c00592 [Mucor ambiguus]
MPLNIAANASFVEKENEGDAVDSSKADDNGTSIDADEAGRVVHGHAEHEAKDDDASPPTAEYSETWIRMRLDFSL